MRLLPIKVRPECKELYSSYYIEFADKFYYAWRCRITTNICTANIIAEVKKDSKYDDWLKHL